MAVTAKDQRWRNKNREHFNALRRKYRKNNPSIYRATEKRSRNKRLKLLWELKNKPCKDCGINYPPYIMQFDHVNGYKEECVSRLNSYKKIIEEANKCEIVCANCHAERTWKRKMKIKE